MKQAAQIGLIAGLLAGPSIAFAEAHDAGSLVPLEKVVKQGAAHSTIALHCAGLFHSVWDYTGEDVLGAEATQQAKSNVAFFIDAGTELRASETGADQNDITDAVVAEAFAVSTLYYKHYAKNVAAGKDAFASDPIWNADLEICRNLAAEL